LDLDNNATLIVKEVRDHGPGLEDYECDGCNNDGFVHMGCGDCPWNFKRMREYDRKYVY
jgi:hypothetical protein